MKKSVALIVGFILCLTCSGQENINQIWKRQIGIDIASAICERGLTLCISQQFSAHWSLDARTMLRIAAPQEMKEHYESLGYAHFFTNTTGEDLITTSARISYWVKEAYAGPYIQVGCVSRIREGVGGEVTAGYCIKIWEGITCGIAYGFILGGTTKNTIGVTISYTY